LLPKTPKPHLIIKFPMQEFDPWKQHQTKKFPTDAEITELQL